MLLGIALAAALLPAAPLPKPPDYQKKADKAPWRFSEERATRAFSVKRLKGLEAQPDPFVFGPGQNLRLSRGGEYLLTFQAHDYTPFLVKGDILYFVRFSPSSTGCTLAAFDMGPKKQTLWRTNLKGLGPVRHSQYRNRVNLDFDGTALRIYGKETAGRYIEFVDIKTGKTIGHKVFKKEK